jgi:hypothetical protein
MKSLPLAALLLAPLVVSLPACAPRQVEVRTGQQPTSEVSLRVTNNLDAAVNVYVVNGGNDLFLKQVSANSSATMNVPGIAAGTTVALKAVPAQGTKAYTRDNVTLSGTYEWTVP